MKKSKIYFAATKRTQKHSIDLIIWGAFINDSGHDTLRLLKATKNDSREFFIK